ncbi:hypothetical protein M9Y10_023937 [Tritrichomonas musculus]|uniref:NlpC/P60 domain-containing protein n=1 Tax=Tritrichomonas musculus TaxID=1915356 RepID=A0ABR2KXK7_9EUKA
MTGKAIANTARGIIGCDYQLGEAGPDKFDCSGLVVYCHAQNNITNVPRTSDQQMTGGKKGYGSEGDVVIMLNGNHAGNGKKVKETLISYIDSNPIYRRYY